MSEQHLDLLPPPLRHLVERGGRAGSGEVSDDLVIFAIDAAHVTLWAALRLRWAALTVRLQRLVAYSLLCWLFGHAYPAVPIFGIAPCPTTIFNIGQLLFGSWRTSRWLLVNPALWSAIGGSAAIVLGVPQNYGCSRHRSSPSDSLSRG